MADPLLLGVAELGAALGVRPTFLDAFLRQPGPAPELATVVPGTVERDHGPRPVEMHFANPWQARAAGLFVGLARAGLPDESAARLAPLAWAGRGDGPLPGRAWVRLRKGRAELREVEPAGHESGFSACDLARVESALSDAFAREALTLADWRELGSYHDVRLLADPGRPALPPEVVAAAARRERASAADLAAFRAIYGGRRGAARVIEVPGPGEREAGETADDDAADALAA